MFCLPSYIDSKSLREPGCEREDNNNNNNTNNKTTIYKAQ